MSLLRVHVGNAKVIEDKCAGVVDPDGAYSRPDDERDGVTQQKTKRA